MYDRSQCGASSDARTAHVCAIYGCYIWLLLYMNAAIYGCCCIWMLLYMAAAVYECCYMWLLLYMNAAIYGCCCI